MNTYTIEFWYKKSPDMRVIQAKSVDDAIKQFTANYKFDYIEEIRERE